MAIGIAYSSQSSGTFNVVFKNFTDNIFPRSYESQSNFTRTSSGTTALAGSGSQQKRIWAVSALVSKGDALELETMFRAWDLDRSDGYSAACGLTDDCFGPSLTTNVVFTTPPSFAWAGPQLVQVDFAVTEL